MTTFEIILATVLSIGIGMTIFLQLRRPKNSESHDSTVREIATLERDLESARDKLSKNEGAGKQMFIELQQVKAKLESTEAEKQQLQKHVTKFETTREQQERENHDMINKLQNAEKALEKERQRVIENEATKRKIAEEERDRLWNDHENDVITTLNDLCKQPQLQFTSFSNSNLPDDFDGSLKPDFLIDFLGQYVVFDAKVSKAQNLQTYIDEQVKKTTEKMKKNDKIYPHVFLVVPTEAISELKKLTFSKDHYTFYVVSREALSPILASLKRISTYELAETLDPQKRENIINMLADLATHISYRNAHELILTKMGTETLERVARTDPELAEEVEQKRLEKKFAAPAPSDIKRIATSLTEQNAEIASLASPKAAVNKKMIDTAQSVMSDKLL